MDDKQLIDSIQHQLDALTLSDEGDVHSKRANAASGAGDQLLEDIIKYLNIGAEEEEEDVIDVRDSKTELLVTKYHLVNHVIKWLSNQVLTLHQVAHLCAELAKSERARVPLSNTQLIRNLIDAIDGDPDTSIVVSKDPTVKTLQLNIIRAIGNICYDNDIGRSLVLEANGIDKLMAIISSVTNRLMASSSCPMDDNLLLVVSGCLMNVLNDFDAGVRYGVERNLVPILINFIKATIQLPQRSQNIENAAMHSLLILHGAAAWDAQSKECLWLKDCEDPPLKSLVDIMALRLTPNLAEALIELLSCLAHESDAIKGQLVKFGLAQTLSSYAQYGEISNIGQGDANTDNKPPNSSEQIRKSSCDLLVLLSTDDESMKLIYDDGDGLVYRRMVAWIVEAKCSLLVSTAALVIGNIARTDENCRSLVNSGIHRKLFKFVTADPVTGALDVRLQHAILSTLRNLVIPRENKSILLADGLLDILLSLTLSIETHPVVFKLIATIRLVIDGQAAAAERLAREEKFLESIKVKALECEHVGITMEARRLFAWIIKNLPSIKGPQAASELPSYPALASASFEPLVKMLSSQNPLMLIEATLALYLIVAKLTIPSSTSHLLCNEQLNHQLISCLIDLIAPQEKSATRRQQSNKDAPQDEEQGSSTSYTIADEHETTRKIIDENLVALVEALNQKGYFSSSQSSLLAELLAALSLWSQRLPPRLQVRVDNVSSSIKTISEGAANASQ